MIEVKNIYKNFDDIIAVNDVSVTFKEGNVFGLIGTNGAGKSTVLRMMSGVLKPDSGTITVDTMKVYDNILAKQKVFFIPDEPYFFSNGTAKDMEKYYSSIYTNYYADKYYHFLKQFELDKNRKIGTFSKGMKKQLAIICGICAAPKYLLCDETFDGLDPVMRQGVKSIFAEEMEVNGMTPIIASHNLRELEDICDHVGLLHKGGVLLSKDLEEMKLNIQKVQCVFTSQSEADRILKILDIVKNEKRGTLHTLTVRGSREEVLEAFNKASTIFFELLQLSLEEIFISETEVVGYDVKKLIHG